MDFITFIAVIASVITIVGFLFGTRASHLFSYAPKESDQPPHSETSCNDEFVQGISQNIYSSVQTVQYSNGVKYIGQMQKGLKHGNGKIVYVNGRVFEGNFRNDKKYGAGVTKYEDGTTLSGYYEDDRLVRKY